MKTRKPIVSISAVSLLFAACSSAETQSTPSPIPSPSLAPISTEISEEAIVATEQSKAMTVQAGSALTLAAQPTFTPPPTPTSILAHLPTLTPISNSTPAAVGAFFDVSPDILGSRYEIVNACYFDTQFGWQRYEIYAGAIAGSGDEYSAQGVAVVRVLQVTEKDGKPFVETVDTKEYLTVQKRGPLHLPLWDDCPDDWMNLITPLNFRWILSPRGGEFYPDANGPPLARMESGGETQLAGIGSYCWDNGCADGGAIGTSSTPLAIPPSMVITLRLPLDEPPDNMGLDAMLVSSPGPLLYDSDVHGDRASWNYEEPGRTIQELGALPLKRDQEIRLFLEPGYYVLLLFAAWRDYGDVTYGFLVEVK